MIEHFWHLMLIDGFFSLESPINTIKIEEEGIQNFTCQIARKLDI